MTIQQPTFKFNLNQKVAISISGEQGLVRARSDNTNGYNQYQVAYCNAQGVASETWWAEDQLINPA